MSNPKPLVALVGRPNTGKSTLFNRLVGEARAIVSEIPGTTRDRLYGECLWNGLWFNVVDTGGMEILAERRRKAGEPGDFLLAASPHYLREIRAQAELAIAEADIVILVTDVRDGVTAADEEVAAVLRRSQKPIFIAANKADNIQMDEQAWDFYSLGLGEVFSISALNGKNVADLLDAVVKIFPAWAKEGGDEDNSIKIAIVGRPNVGKSSLLNKLLRQERAIVSPVAGTTRDAIDTQLVWEGVSFTLIDTAGIRRRGKVEPGLERYSVLRAMRAISRCDVALLLIDAADGVTDQDAHIAGYILDEYKSVVVVINKWDTLEKDTYTIVEWSKQVRSDLKFMSYVPLLFISALTGQRVHKVLPTALAVQEARLLRIPTGELNRIVQEAVIKHSPPSKSGRRLKFFYATQSALDPPTFVFFVNDTRLVHFGYKRYLENQLRANHDFLGTPLRLTFRSRGRR
ncbi:MAG: ribosome biogenesis GTPase Der [Anaerolineaceae bacterium 4572_32.1]|nr:MAG: ribosome biogenesis GTPase Der [Anaerolineaceae bacterium 4572_32.1]